jgi:hypothetical protein
MTVSTNTPRFRFWLWLIRFVGLIVPRRLRADWLLEREAAVAPTQNVAGRKDGFTPPDAGRE